MSRRVVAVLVLTAALLAGCSDDEDAARDESPVASSTEPAAVTSGERQVVLRSEFATDAEALQAAADVVGDALERRGVTDAQVSVDGGRLVVSSADPDLTSTLESMVSGSVSVHPVLSCTTDESATSTDASTAQWPALASGELCNVGPAASGVAFLPTAVPAIIEGGWSVTAELRPGAQGLDAFNTVAAWCFGGTDECPSQRLAIVVDGQILTAPTVNVPVFDAQVQIAGEFPETEAAGIASTINLAALGLTIEPA